MLKHSAVTLLLISTCCLSVLCSCSVDTDGTVSPSAVISDITTANFGETTLSTSSVETTISTTTAAKTTTTTTTSATVDKNSTTKTTKTTKKTTTSVPVIPPSSSSKGYIISGVPVIHQMPDYPSGCESVCAVMALRYWGEDVSVDTFVEKYLPKDNRFYWKNGKKHGPDPYEFFIGDPRSTQSYGCMAPVIEKALVSYFDSEKRVTNSTGKSLEELCETYIRKDMPVLMWGTIGMIDTEIGDQWLLEDGTLFGWPNNEHCMVLIGYDSDYYYLNDPYRGTVKKYAKWLVEKRYQQLGKQSLVITD